MQNSLSLTNVWADKYVTNSRMRISPYGWCNTFNSAVTAKMFHENSTAKYFEGIKANNRVAIDTKLTGLDIKPPIHTSKKELGYLGILAQDINPLFRCTQFYELCKDTNKQTRVVIHSPFEMMDLRHRSFVMNNKEIYKVTIVPQIKITDGTLLGQDVDEYENLKFYFL